MRISGQAQGPTAFHPKSVVGSQGKAHLRKGPLHQGNRKGPPHPTLPRLPLLYYDRAAQHRPVW